jgi:hypothetical protein
MRSAKVLLPSAILAGGFLICTSSIYGTPQYAKETKKSCTYCHNKVSANKADMLKNLNATGTCFKDNNHSLASCPAPAK